MNKENFVSDKEWLRAKRLIRKLMFRKTMNKEPNKYGSFFPDWKVGIEGQTHIRIDVEHFSLTEKEYERFMNIDEIDSFHINDNGLHIYVKRECDEE